MMPIIETRLRLAALLFVLASVLASAGAYAAQQVQKPAAETYPLHAIRLVLPFPPGGGTDTLGRILAQRLSQVLGQGVVPENRAGAGGNIGNELVAKSAADGYTLLLGSPSLVISPNLYPRLNYDASRDLAPVAMIAEIPLVFTVHRDVAARTMRDLIRMARAQPGKLAIGTGGAGTSNELSAQLFLSTLKLKILVVPHKGVNQATTALLGGHVDMVIAGLSTVSAHIRDGKLRGLALLGPERSPRLPEVPTAAQAGLPWLQVRAWYIVMAPAATSQAIIEKLNAALNEVTRTVDVRTHMVTLGFEPISGTPAEAGRFFAVEAKRWAKLAQAAGVRVGKP
jgi:tripartite-type tricarboxylate transporter receptor subunit TctC